jgi:hypothetical protein
MGGAIDGWVRAEGQPVASALVVASRRWARAGSQRRSSVARSTRWTRSDRDGRFRMPSLPPGSYLMTAMGAERGMARARAVDVRDGEAVRDLELSLAAAAAGLEGRVLDTGAGAIARARIRATSDGADPVVYETQSACLGRYRLEVPPGLYAIEIEADGYVSVRFSMVLGSPGRRDFWLRPGARAGGQVVIGAHRGAVPGATLVARQERDSPHGIAESYATDADDDGNFVFTWLPPGTYQIEARWGALLGRRDGVVVAEAARVDGIEVRLSPPPRAVDEPGGLDGAAIFDGEPRRWVTAQGQQGAEP